MFPAPATAILARVLVTVVAIIGATLPHTTPAPAAPLTASLTLLDQPPLAPRPAQLGEPPLAPNPVMVSPVSASAILAMRATHTPAKPTRPQPARVHTTTIKNLTRACKTGQHTLVVGTYLNGQATYLCTPINPSTNTPGGPVPNPARLWVHATATWAPLDPDGTCNNTNSTPTDPVAAEAWLPIHGITGDGTITWNDKHLFTTATANHGPGCYTITAPN